MIKIDVFADVVCPWCYIGEARLDQALAQRPDLQVERAWRPFQLQPEMPATGLPWGPFAARKFGGPEGARTAYQHVIQAAEQDGIAFDFDKIASAPNTVDAHRVILWAAEQGKGEEAAKTLFRAYFAEGKDLNNPEHLLEAAASAGLEREGTQALLSSDQFRQEVFQSQAGAYRLGVSGVPFFVFAEHFAVSGAQPVEVFVMALDKSAELLAQQQA